jgi:hypothetical protein
MIEDGMPAGEKSSGAPLLSMFGAATDYMIDAAQRSILYCDVMRQRGNEHREQAAKAVPHVLDHDVELIMDGRKFERHSITAWSTSAWPAKNTAISQATST